MICFMPFNLHKTVEEDFKNRYPRNNLTFVSSDKKLNVRGNCLARNKTAAV